VYGLLGLRAFLVIVLQDCRSCWPDALEPKPLLEPRNRQHPHRTHRIETDLSETDQICRKNKKIRKFLSDLREPILFSEFGSRIANPAKVLTVFDVGAFRIGVDGGLSRVGEFGTLPMGSQGIAAK
jgi:hypothetical protein